MNENVCAKHLRRKQHNECITAKAVDRIDEAPTHNSLNIRSYIKNNI
jgi:hypothetical protein